MKDMIRVIVKKPGRRPYSTHIANSLKSLQGQVEGYIETLPVGNMLMIVNEEGKLKHLQANFYIKDYKDVIHGNAVFVGTTGEDLADCPMTFKEFKDAYPQLWAGDVAII